MNREYRVSPWKKLWWDDAKYTHMRIHQKFDGTTMYQSHEWMLHNGMTFREKWIVGVKAWSDGSVVVKETVCCPNCGTNFELDSVENDNV